MTSVCKARELIDLPNEERGQMQRTSEDGNGTPRPGAPAPMFSDAQMRKLKIAVVGMGVLLLAGFTLVVGRIVYLLNRPSVDQPSLQEVDAARVPSGPSVRLVLPEGAVVRHISLSGNRLAVHFDAQSGSGIRILELSTGRPIQQIDLTAEKYLPK